MIWKKFYNCFFLMLISFLAYNCVFYTFSGSALSKKVKNFSIQLFYNNTRLAPAILNTQLKERLSERILTNTALKEVLKNGDIQYTGTITEYHYTPMVPQNTAQGAIATRTKLTITVEVSYYNKYEKEFEFTKKSFTQSSDIDATANRSTEEPKMIQEIIDKLVQDIMNASIDNW